MVARKSVPRAASRSGVVPRRMSGTETMVYIVLCGKQRGSQQSDFLRKQNPERVIFRISATCVEKEISGAVLKCVARGLKQFLILTEHHLSSELVKSRIPDSIRKVREKHPDIDFHFNNLGLGAVTDSARLIDG